MKRQFAGFAGIVLAFTLQAGDATAWESQTTHAGLSEESALSSALHTHLREHLGATRGLYTMLSVPEADAPGLFDVLRRLNPTHGYVPDARGRMSALAWLVAGSVIADVPAEHAANHFFDPRSGKGLSNARADGLGNWLRELLFRARTAGGLDAGGEPAATWWKSQDNPLGYVGFTTQLRKAVASRTLAERDRHLAGALLAAGSMLHVLQDMGSPSHVRDDIAAHRKKIGNESTDRGSRFERIAALAFGRLGIPGSIEKPALSTLAAHFSSAEKSGLADITERQYLSEGTLPRTVEIKRDAGASVFRRKLDEALRRPEPSPHARLDIVAARNSKGATWHSESGVCLTRYKWRRSEVTWWIDDSCALEQIEEILPVVAAYGVSFLETLFPGDLSIETQDGGLAVSVASTRYGEGSLRVFADTADGIRTEYHSVPANAGQTLFAAVPAPPTGSSRITVLFDGVDSTGSPLLATSSSPWPIPSK